jgi:Notch-like protein
VTRVDVAGSLTGAAFAGFDFSAAPESLVLSVDGVAQTHAVAASALSLARAVLTLNDLLLGAAVSTSADEYSCACENGWAGRNCDVEIYDCESAPCAHSGLCVEAVGSYSCVCPAGYSGDNCEGNVDDCTSGPCNNGGICSDEVQAWRCFCTIEYGGERCDDEVNYCALGTDDCDRARSECIYTTPGYYRCDCAAGYLSSNGGLLCDDFDECGSGPCLNGATCQDSTTERDIRADRYQCLCVDGYTGGVCETDIDECIAQPCQNGGACTAGDGFYTCACPAGWYSYNCEVEIDECRGNPCKHGSCTDRFLGYDCACEAGWAGTQCDTDVDECTSGPCNNGATCDDLVDEYRCTCGAGFAGVRCGTVVDNCASAPCQRTLEGAVCTSGFAGSVVQEEPWKCACPAGYDGVDCSVVVDMCERQLDDCDRLHAACVATAPGAFSCACAAGWSGATCATDTQVRPRTLPPVFQPTPLADTSN